MHDWVELSYLCLAQGNNGAAFQPWRDEIDGLQLSSRHRLHGARPRFTTTRLGCVTAMASSSLSAVNHVQYTTSGTVSWSDITAKSVTYSIELLSRIAGAGINPYTIVVGQVLADSFRLSREGQQNVQLALTKLKGVQAWGGMLWIGFGVKSVVYDLATTEQGIWLLAFCGALNEAYQDTFAAEVLQEMVATIEAPDRLKPSSSEWLAVIKATGALFATSKLPLIMEGLERLLPVPAGEHAWPRYLDRPVPQPEDLAKILMAMGRVSKKELLALHVVGGWNCIWILAIAVWLFSLKVRLVNTEGEILYTNHATGESQVECIFRGEEPMDDNGDLCLASTTYLLLPDDLLVEPDEKLPYMGRVPWHRCLEVIFGPSLVRALEVNADVTGIVVSCTIRWLQLGVINKNLHHSIARYLSLTEGYSQIEGLVIRNMKRWFPEAIFSEDEVGIASAMNLEEVKQLYLESCGRVSMSAMNLCLRNVLNCTLVPEPQAAAFLLDRLLRTCLLLSMIDAEDELLPTKTGLFYQLTRCWRDPDGAVDPSCLIAPDPSLHGMLLCTPYLHTSQQSILQVAAFVYAGSRCDYLTIHGDADLSAVCMFGLCFSYAVLEGLSTDENVLLRVRVRPGSFEREGKLHYELRDMRIGPEGNWPSLGSPSVSLVVRETATKLLIAYHLRDSTGSGAKIAPAALHEKISLWRRMFDITCGGDGCGMTLQSAATDANRPGAHYYKVQDGASDDDGDNIGASWPKVNNSEVWVYHADEGRACLAIQECVTNVRYANAMEGGEWVLPILSGQACTACCLRTAREMRLCDVALHQSSRRFVPDIRHQREAPMRTVIIVG